MIEVTRAEFKSPGCASNHRLRRTRARKHRDTLRPRRCREIWRVRGDHGLYWCERLRGSVVVLSRRRLRVGHSVLGRRLVSLDHLLQRVDWAFEEAHEKVLQLWVKVSLRLLDEQNL